MQAPHTVAPVLVLAAFAACGGKTPGKTQSFNATIHGEWSEPVEPFRVVGNIYYVGARHIASYLVSTPDGLIVIDTGTREMEAAVSRNIEALGFAVRDVELVLCTHAHYDHVQGHAALVRASGAEVVVMRPDAEALRSGVDRSPLGEEGWDPVPVARVIDDGADVVLGDATLHAIHAPGHTPGCTVWTTTAREGDRDLAVVLYGCARPNDSVQLVDNAKFPKLVEEAEYTFGKMRELTPDFVLLTHPDDADRTALREHRSPVGWNEIVDGAESEFRAQLAKQRGSLR